MRYWLVPDLEGLPKRRNHYSSHGSPNRPVLFSSTQSIAIGPFDSAAELGRWAGNYPLYHGRIHKDDEDHLSPPKVDVVLEPEVVARHWARTGNPIDVLESIKDEATRELLVILLDPD